LGVNAPLHVRVQNLKREDMTDANIFSLIDRDSGEEIAYGQQVTKAYVLSDYFMRLGSSNVKELENQTQRFVDTVFGTRIVTPTKHETAMHHAWVAAANSACLSRNVGAALADRGGQLISVGWNDVPKFGGGLYQSEVVESETDERCMNRHGGKCFNDEEKNGLAESLFSELVDADLLVEAQRLEFIAIVKQSKLRNLIEFSRSIHAEMHAIISAIDSEGPRVKEGILYTTTYPCHSCARHIVSAGISHVYYLEPYRKSLATKLHDDSLTEDEKDQNRVRILPYFGVAPKRYFALFMPGSRERKNSDTGDMIRYPKSASKPIESTSIESLPTLESIVVRSVEEAEGDSELE
jgi:deoxycytidylate deaminase